MTVFGSLDKMKQYYIYIYIYIIYIYIYVCVSVCVYSKLCKYFEGLYKSWLISCS